MNYCIRRMRPLALPLALAAAFPVHAQTTLSETVVTATRVESRASALLSDVTVIDRETIENNTGRTVPELLARMAGVQMAANGGLGKNSSVFIRGTESRHVLLLVDGVRMGSATTGQASFDNIPLEMIERIEVLKGPASALYGSDAIGGVIQIFTRQGREGMHPHASVTLGSEGRREATVGLSGGRGDISYSLGAQTLREKGFSATNPAASFGNFNPDRDGFSQQSVNASLAWRFAPDWKADARLLYADGKNHYDSGPSSFDTHADVQSRVGAVGVEGRILDDWKTRLNFASSADDSTSFEGRAPSRFNTTQDQWAWTNEVGTRVGKLLVGLERLVQKVDSTTAYTVTRRSTDSAFAGIVGEYGPHGWQFNARHDDDSQFGGASTGLVAYGYRFTPQLRLHGAYGTSFKAPSFNQLYYPGFGNPNLQPERGRNAELGLSYMMGLHEFKFVRFDNRIRGFITGTTLPANVPRARIEGWTLGYDAQLGVWGLHAALDLLDARNTQNGRKLPRRADEQLTASLDYATGAWKLGGTLLAVSERFDDTANRVRLSGFATLDLHADHALSRDWTLQARLNNLADKQYQTANGFNQPGRAVYLTLRYQPK
ncbi:TonB-dependent receptor domain-containing protein [Acidovorax soli]|uniref:Vitamin B12 transporter n=1 Tax=Acidovorax soli TaxID=592050 RepID=A0A1H3ZDQ9_9BURK|nr:TonB-dependent receptor [Acidovorax soli]SEA21866.1 vitamin B12 transporter [Acidovorax soli]